MAVSLNYDRGLGPFLDDRRQPEAQHFNHQPHERRNVKIGTTLLAAMRHKSGAEKRRKQKTPKESRRNSSVKIQGGG
jgi:hypothetical protein